MNERTNKITITLVKCQWMSTAVFILKNKNEQTLKLKINF